MGLIEMLRARYPAPTYAFFEELRNGTGYSRATRSADAVAFGLWPSRGLMLHGFECKVSRSDWKRELDQPEKAEAIQQFCDHWWVVVSDASFVRDGELPPTWGLLAATKGFDEHSKLKCIKEAPKLEAKPLDRLMLASMFRNVADSEAARFAARADAMVSERIAAAPKEGAERELETLRRTHERLVESVRDFERKSGLSLRTGYHGPQLSGLVHLLSGQNWRDGTLASIRRAAETCATRYATAADEAIRIKDEVDALLRELEEKTSNLAPEAA